MTDTAAKIDYAITQIAAKREKCAIALDKTLKELGTRTAEESGPRLFDALAADRWKLDAYDYVLRGLDCDGKAPSEEVFRATHRGLIEDLVRETSTRSSPSPAAYVDVIRDCYRQLDRTLDTIPAKTPA